MDEIRKKTQYSQLWQCYLSGSPTQETLREELKIAIDRVSRAWHMKPGAIYLKPEDHVKLSLLTCNSIPVLVGDDTIPFNAFLFTDGSEFD